MRGGAGAVPGDVEVSGGSVTVQGSSSASLIGGQGAGACVCGGEGGGVSVLGGSAAAGSSGSVSIGSADAASSSTGGVSIQSGTSTSDSSGCVAISSSQVLPNSALRNHKARVPRSKVWVRATIYIKTCTETPPRPVLTARVTTV